MIPEIQQDIIIRGSNPATPATRRRWSRFSGWTIRVLEELQNNGGMTVAQIAERVNHRRNDIRVICNRLYRSGCIEPLEKWGWKITSAGIFLLSIQLSNTNITQTKHKHNTNITLRQFTLAPYSNSEFSDPELALTNLLISHYEKTGQLFIYLEYENQLCELVCFPPDVVKAARMRLRQNGVAYLWFDKTEQAWQYRLYKPFLERLKHC